MRFWKSSVWMFSFMATLAALLLMGCAGSSPGEDRKEEAPDKASSGLENLRPQLRASEDSLILDLLLGYQSLLANDPDADSLNPQTRRAHEAQSQLEYMLRYGGVVSHGREGRVLALPNGVKLTLQDMVAQMSRALLLAGVDTAWKPEVHRAKEIVKHTPELSALIEDANWILALSAALDGPLPADVKKKLRQLHKSYANGAAQDEIARQVNALLPKINEESLRKELKKLANRSWDRDKRSGKMDSAQTVPLPSFPAKTRVPLPQLPPPKKMDSVRADVPPSRQIDTTKATASPQPITPVKSSPVGQEQDSLRETEYRIDSLISKGSYLEALRVLETVEDQASPKWLREHRQNLGNRFCEERRNNAALAFIAARRTKVDSVRIRYLTQTLASLDSCLFQFPDAPVSEKVRKNRALVDKELRR